MSTHENLYDFLTADVEDASELEHVLGQHFGGAGMVSSTEVVYPSHSEQYALKLAYAKGQLAKILAGPTLKESDLTALRTKVQDELIKSDGFRVGEEVLFGIRPVTGYFRYRDVFQILPLHADAPRPRAQMGDHPFLLQFRFRSSASWTVKHLRRQKLGRQLELLLVGLLSGPVHTVGKTARQHWVLLPTNEGEKWRTAECQEMYLYDGFKGEQDDFAPVNGFTPVGEMEPDKYYSIRGIGAGEVFEVPTTLLALLDRFYALGDDKRDQFLRSCFWFQQASSSHSYSRSVSFTSLISAVEALMPPESAPEKCPQCGRSVAKGPTQRFKEFVDTFAPQPQVASTNRRRLYAIRSALSHGGRLLPSDHLSWWGGLTPERAAEYEDMSGAWSMLRVILVNWLNSQTTDAART